MHSLEQEMWRRLHNHAEQLISPDDVRTMIERTSSGNAVREIEARSLAKRYHEAESERDGDLQTKASALVNSQPEDFQDSFHRCCTAYQKKVELARSIQRMYGTVEVQGPIVTGMGRER
jgi:hypothetical protein